jgi:broad specificity phosphatase PhoE
MENGISGRMGVLVESMPKIPPHNKSFLNSSVRSPYDVTERIDRLIKDIREKYHNPVIGKPKGEAPPGDVLLVAHGHILRAFAMRWVGKTLQDGPTFLLEAGGVGALSYEHHRIEEPAILLGGGFMVDVVEASSEDEKRQRT